MGRQTANWQHWYDQEGIVPIPIKLGTKNQPLIKWSKWQHERPARALVNRWFGHGDVNIGLLMGGESGVFCLDHDKIPAWARWKAKHRDIETLTVITPRPGRHNYFKLPGKTLTTMCFDGLDVKCSGYTLAPGSLHPSGKRYEGNGKAILNIDDLAQVLDLVQTKRESVSNTVSLPTILSELDHMAIRRLDCTRTDLIGSIKQALPLLTLVEQHTEFMARSSQCGRWYICSCPFHDDHHPSFWIDSVRQICSCYKSECRAGQPRGLPMDIFNFYSRLHGLGNRQAIQALANELGA